MSEPFVAEIKIFAGNFAPTGWATCDGQLLSISQNTALFSLLGTTFGGDGRSNFALPNLQGRAPMAPGQGPGLSDHQLGESSGTEYVSLGVNELPSHNHNFMAANFPGDSNQPTNNAIARSSEGAVYSTATSPLVQLSPNALAPTGDYSPHNNMQPYLTLTFIIALQGVFPQRP